MSGDPVKGLEQLRPPEGDAWGGFLAVHALVTRALDADLRARHGLSLSAYEALLKLAWAPGGSLRMNELAQKCLLTPGGVTRLVASLVADGLVERELPPDNRRVVLAKITDAGVRVLRSAHKTHLAGVRARFMQHLDDETAERLGEVWRRIREAQSTEDSAKRRAR